MYQTDLLPSPDLASERGQVHLLLADGQRISIFAMQGHPRKVRLAIDAPETIKIHFGKLDLPK